jgi:L-fuculose-phosphate aldolase
MQKFTPGFGTEDATSLRTRVHSEIESAVSESSLGLREKIALSCRFLAEQGHARTLAGQISVREDNGSFWTTGFGTGFGETSVSSLVRVDSDLKVLEGHDIANPATRFHMWVYEKRPDVRCIVHTHPPHASALSMSGKPLIVSHMDMTMFHDDLAQLHEWPGVPIANEEGVIISEAIADKSSLLLAHHGILTVGGTLEKALYLAVNLEYAAQLQYLCTSSGTTPKPVAAHLAREAREFVTAPKVVQATVDCWLRLMLRRYPEAVG